MKFLIYIPQLIFGGAEKVLVSFANDLVSRGHQVDVIELYERGLLKPQFDSRVHFDAICSTEYTEKYYASLAQIKANPSLKGKLAGCCKLAFSKLVGYRKYAEKLAAKRYADKHYDVAVNYLETEPPTFLLDHVKADKYIQWYHTDVQNSDDPENTDKIIGEFARTDAIICVAEKAKENFVSRYPDLAEKTHLIYNFFDNDSIVRMGDESFSYGDDRFVMLSVGRLTSPKQYPRFLDVLARLRRDGYDFSWHILGVGAEYDSISRKIDELGLGDCVFLDGVTENPYKYMKNCDLFVLPSGWEGFPTVTVEAKILGCPVLATDVSGVREQMTHGETGWIVENSESGLYSGLKHLLDTPDLIEKLRSNKGMEKICSNDEKYNEIMRIIDGTNRT